MCQVIIKKKEGFGDFFEGWVPFLLEIKQKTGWLVGMIHTHTHTRSHIICKHTIGMCGQGVYMWMYFNLHCNKAAACMADYFVC